MAGASPRPLLLLAVAALLVPACQRSDPAAREAAALNNAADMLDTTAPDDNAEEITANAG